MEKLWESQKTRAQETQMLEGMTKSKEKVIVKTKWGCPIKTLKRTNKRKAVKEKDWKTQ
jgi:hypothetical protein